jgi:hypothetical protein
MPGHRVAIRDRPFRSHRADQSTTAYTRCRALIRGGLMLPLTIVACWLKKERHVHEKRAALPAGPTGGGNYEPAIDRGEVPQWASPRHPGGAVDTPPELPRLTKHAAGSSRPPRNERNFSPCATLAMEAVAMVAVEAAGRAVRSGPAADRSAEYPGQAAASRGWADRSGWSRVGPAKAQGQGREAVRRDRSERWA